MKATIDRRAFTAGMKAVLPAVGRTNMQPILDGVRIDATKTGIDLCATNLDLTCTAVVDDPSNVTAGSIVTPAALLGRIIDKMSGDTVTIETDDVRLVVTSGETVATLPTWPVADWPRIPEVEGDEVTFGDEDVDLLARILPMAGVDTERPNLCVLHLKDGRGACTDSYRLGTVTGLPSTPEALIPATAVKAMLGAPFALTVGDHAARFTAGNRTVTIRLVEATYPDYERLLPDPGPHAIACDTNALADAIDRVSTIGLDAKNPVVTLETDGGKLLVTGRDASGNSVVDVVDCTSDYDGKVSFHPARLVDHISAMGADVELSIADNLKPVTSRSERLTVLIMPVRVA